MKPSCNTLLALLVGAYLFTGSASSGATPAGSAESPAATPSDTSTTQPAPDKKKPAEGDAEPECD